MIFADVAKSLDVACRFVCVLAVRTICDTTRQEIGRILHIGALPSFVRQGTDAPQVRTKRGRRRYALRMQTVEPAFGPIKLGRAFRQFLLRS